MQEVARFCTLSSCPHSALFGYHVCGAYLMIGTMYPQFKFNFDLNDVFFRDIPFDFVKSSHCC